MKLFSVKNIAGFAIVLLLIVSIVYFRYSNYKLEQDFERALANHIETPTIIKADTTWQCVVTGFGKDSIRMQDTMYLQCSNELCLKTLNEAADRYVVANCDSVTISRTQIDVNKY